MEKKLIVFAIYVCSLLAIQGCNTLSLADNKQTAEQVSATSPINADSLINSELGQHLKEWQTMKPSLERLVAIESELKELIAQLSGMATTQTAPEASQQNLTDLANETDSANIATQDNPTAETFTVEPPKVAVALPIPQVTPQIVALLPPAQIVVAPKSAKPKVTADYGLQLASIRNSSKLAVSWQRLVNKHPILLGALQPVYEKKMVKNVMYYRLKAGGFSTRKAATNLCEKLFSQGTQCILTNYTGITF